MTRKLLTGDEWSSEKSFLMHAIRRSKLDPSGMVTALIIQEDIIKQTDACSYSAAEKWILVTGCSGLPQRISDTENRNTVKIWKNKCWKNMKGTTKKNAPYIRRSQFLTGVSVFTNFDERVLVVQEHCNPLPSNSNWAEGHTTHRIKNW